MSSRFFCSPAILLKRTPVLAVVLSGCVASANAQTGGTNASLPADPGMYVQAGNGFSKIIGQIAQFTRTGSRLVSTATVGIKSAKANIQLAGPHAQTAVSPQPVFYFVPPKQEAAAGVNAGDFILIRLEEKSKRRQFEIAAAGLFRASAGISLTHQIQILRSEPQPGIYQITPAMELSKGEYALYLARGEGMAAYVYDFGVQGATSVRSLQTNPMRNASVTAEPSLGSTSNNAINFNDPAGGRATAIPQPTDKRQQSPASVPTEVPATFRGGVLGVTGADWNERGATGVEIIDVADGSSALLAGLHKGNVITDINGTHVGSNQDLARILAQMGPGSRINIGYLYKSNLGWMPQETVAILGKRD